MSKRNRFRRRSGMRRARARKQFLSRRLSVEPLEDRSMLAAIVVDTPLDVFDLNDEVTSLREAISLANLAPGPDVIQFDEAKMSDQTIALNGTPLQVVDGLTIIGLGRFKSFISGNNQSGVFEFAAGQTSSIAGLQIREGLGPGITNAGTLFVRGSRIVNNTNLLGSTIPSDPSDEGKGGGIFNSGTLLLTDSSVVLNRAVVGGGILNKGGELTLIRSSVSSNKAGTLGGGILTISHGTRASVTKVFDSRFVANELLGPLGPDIAINRGIAIANDSGRLVVEGSLITRNVALDGAYGSILAGGQTSVTNSTISQNTSGVSVLSDSSLTLDNVTITENGAGLTAWVRSTALLNNTIIAGNIEDVLVFSVSISGSHNLIGQTANSGGLVHGVDGNIVGVDPKLGPLGSYGSSTFLHALLDDSPAIDAGSNALVVDADGVPLAYDQRGPDFARIQAGTVDIGAFETAARPRAVDDAAVTDEDLSVVIDILRNDSDPIGNGLNITVSTQPAHGILLLRKDNTLTYIPDDNFNGRDTFAYTIEDDLGRSDGANVSIVVRSVNDATEITAPAEQTINEDTTLVFSNNNGNAISISDIDIADGPLEVALRGVHGTILLGSSIGIQGSQEGDTLTFEGQLAAVNNALEGLTFFPLQDYNGPAAIEITAIDLTRPTDDPLRKDTASISIEVLSVNDPPLALDDRFITAEDSSITGNVLADNGMGPDLDVDGSSLFVTLVSGSGPQHGNLSLNADGSFTYQPDYNFNGKDGFSYISHDPDGATDTATVDLTLTPVNDPPRSQDDSFVSAEEVLLTGNVLNDNDQGADFDVDGDSLFVTLVSGSGPQHGNLSLNADGSFTYQPDHNSNGGDGFSYTIVDPDGETDTATVSILVTPVNDPPVLTLISPQNAFEDVPLAMSGLSVSDDDAAEGNGFMQVTLAVAHGTLHISSTVPGGVESVHLVGNGQRKVVVTAPLDAINATLAAADGLTYVGTLDFHGADTLIALVGDLGNTGTPGVLTDTGSVPISVLSSAEQLTNLNDAVLAIGATGELNRGQIKGLDSSLNAATRNLEQDNLVASSNLIFKFVRQVNAFNNAGLLSNPYTRDLVESSRILIKSIQRSQEDAVGRYPPSPSCWTRSGLCRQQQSSRQPAHGLSIDDLDSLFGDLEFC